MGGEGGEERRLVQSEDEQRSSDLHSSHEASKKTKNSPPHPNTIRFKPWQLSLTWPRPLSSQSDSAAGGQWMVSR